jgi:hypothetical protein
LVNDYFIVTGYSGTWRGKREIIPGYSSSIESVIGRMKVDDIKIQFDKDRECIEIIGEHHDGTNRMYLKEVIWYSKSDLYKLIKEVNDLHDVSNDELNNHCKTWYDKKFKQLTKSELIELLSEEGNLENYN